MAHVKIIFNSNRGSYETQPDIPSEFEELSFEGIPSILHIGSQPQLAEIQEFIDCHPEHYILGYLGYAFGSGLLNIPFNNHATSIDLPHGFLMAVKEVKKSEEKKRGIHTHVTPSITLQQIVSKEKYIQKITTIKNHIQLGDIYELNYCIPFVAENVEINAEEIWENLNRISPMPFASFIDHPDFSIISASPERFIKKKKGHLLIQPMKGTRRKGNGDIENRLLKEELKNDPKEKSENVMIVDLTRNDLSKIALKGTVHVDELYGVYSFSSIHQMISTVSCKIENNLSFTEILKATFPMGSMTGTPKKRAMELIDELEDFNRGPFSGMLGYIAPQGDFDFNVMIRTVFYDKKKKKIMLAVGSAITSKSDIEKEYEECLIKLQPLLQALNAKIG